MFSMCVVLCTYGPPYISIVRCFVILLRNKAEQVHQGMTAFSGPAHVNPFSPTHVSFYYSVLWDCATGAGQVI